MKRTTQAIAAVCAALVLASCGDDGGDPIPSKQAARLVSLLQQVQRQSDAGSCTTLLKQTIPALEDRARNLPDSVGSDTQATITDGIGRLRDLAETDCAQKQQEELPTTDESTTTSEPSTSTTTEETTTTTEPSTSTDTTPSTSTETTPSTDTTPPDNPDTGNGGTPPPGVGGVGGATPKPGNGNGRGNGGGKP